MTRSEVALAALAARQHGAFTMEQAIALGFAPTTVEDRLGRGMYCRVEESVIVLSGSPDTWRRSVAVATLSIGSLAAASHQTAAYLWGLLSWRPRRIEVVATRWERRHRTSFVVHESTDLLPRDVVEVQGLAATSPVRTVVDLGASNRHVVASALDTGIREDLFTLDDVERFVVRVARRGRRGVGVIRPHLEARRRLAVETESELEDLFIRIVGDSYLPDPVGQFVVRDGRGAFVCRADFAYPDRRLLIELDGARYHMDLATFRRDRAKQNRTLGLGWRTLRFTWSDLTEEPGRVCRDIYAALSQPFLA